MNQMNGTTKDDTIMEDHGYSSRDTHKLVCVCPWGIDMLENN